MRSSLKRARIEGALVPLPATWTFGYAVVHTQTRDEWRRWLSEHHATAKGVWLCSWKSATGKPAVPYVESVLEALCFGWIDSTRSSFDDDRSLQLMTPRKAKSTWTRLNRERYAELDAAGLMTDAGRKCAAVAQANGWWTILDPVEDLLEPADLAAALEACADARHAWDAFPASPRKAMLWWVLSAVKPETRARRISAIVAKAERGERAKG